MAAEFQYMKQSDGEVTLLCRLQIHLSPIKPDGLHYGAWKDTVFQPDGDVCIGWERRRSQAK
jgi:hypothetical protein